MMTGWPRASKIGAYLEQAVILGLAFRAETEMPPLTEAA
jgi:hypothetical protein